MQNPESSSFVIKELDEITRAVVIKLPCSKIVYLQGLMESYEGLGTIRTLDPQASLVAVITTNTLLSEVLDLLNSEKAILYWENPQNIEKIEIFKP